MDFTGELTFDMIGNMSDEEFKDKDSQENQVTEDIDEASPFEFDTTEENVLEDPEGVGDESQEDGKPTSQEEGTSPNFYASIASSLKADGILNLLDDTDFENINDATSLASLFQKQIDSMLDDNQRRIKQVLEYGIPVDQVRKYENAISYLDSITEEDIKAETQDSEQLRGNILVQDYMNKGFSQERANREAKKSFDAGTDIEDALEALKEVKEFYKKEYQTLIETTKAEKEALLAKEKEDSKKLEKLFLETEEPIKGLKLTPSERKKILNQYTTFVDKDGNVPMNAIQKYAKENPVEYQYNINLLYYLTDGFKDIGKVVQKQVKKQTKSALSDLERKLRNPANNVGSGGLDFGNDTSPDSYKGLTVVLD